MSLAGCRFWSHGFSTQPRQLGDVDRNPPRHVAGEQVRRQFACRLIFERDVGQRLLVGVAQRWLLRLAIGLRKVTAQADPSLIEEGCGYPL